MLEISRCGVARVVPGGCRMLGDKGVGDGHVSNAECMGCPDAGGSVS